MVDDDGKRWNCDEYQRHVMPDAEQRDRITYEGRLPPERIRALRKTASVVVIASRFEVFPYALLEALSQGCPVVATRAGGIPEIVQDEKNGLLAKPADAKDLAEKIARLLKDKELATRLGRQARLDCECRYDPQVIARQTLAYYAEILSNLKGKVSA